jgi:hypothetical protein
VDEVLSAIEHLDLGRPWQDVAPSVYPMMPRVRPMPPDTDEYLRKTYPPGLQVGFGMDIGPAVLHIGRSQTELWEVTEEQVAERALANVRDRTAARRQFGLIRESVAGVPVTAFQSREGWASALVLVPDELARIMGDGPALLLVPMRDLVFRLPIDTDVDFARSLLDEFVSLDPNGLAVPMLALVDGELRFAPAPEPSPSPARRH